MGKGEGEAECTPDTLSKRKVQCDSHSCFAAD